MNDLKNNASKFEEALKKDKEKFITYCQSLDGYNENLLPEVENAWQKIEDKHRTEYATLADSIRKKATKNKNKSYFSIIFVIILLIVMIIVGQYAKYGGF